MRIACVVPVRSGVVSVFGDSGKVNVRELATVIWNLPAVNDRYANRLCSRFFQKNS